MLNSKNRVFNTYLLIGTCPMRKTTFADNLRVEPSIFFMEKITFSLKLFSGHFYGQSFIKTVRGPCSIPSKVIDRNNNLAKILAKDKRAITQSKFCG